MSTLFDSAGRRRSPATMPGYRAGWSPRNKGRVYPADPPRVEEIIAVMRAAGETIPGARVRAPVVILWAGLRINEALTLAETDLEPRRGSILVRHGRAANDARLGWTTGVGADRAVAAPPPRVAGRPVPLRHCRCDPRADLVTDRRPLRAATARR